MLTRSMKNQIAVSLAFLYILYYVLTGISRRVNVDRYTLKGQSRQVKKIVNAAQHRKRFCEQLKNCLWSSH